MKARTLKMLAVGMLLSTGCQRYEREPLDIGGYETQWRDRVSRLGSVEEYLHHGLRPGEVSDAQRGGAFDASDGLSLAEAESVALVFNPELRVARLAAGVPLAGARQAGRWEDPELDFELMRIVESVSEPWVAGVGIGFTIPLSGRLSAQKDAAWAGYSESWRRAALREWEVLVSLRVQWVEWSVAKSRAALLEEYLTRLDEVRSVADRLAEAGAMAPTDARVFTLESGLRREELERLKADAEGRRLELMALLGLLPEARVELLGVVEATSVEPPTLEDRYNALRDHPELAVKRAEYEVAEQALRREILKQYPDLTIGPVYENEEGQSRIGLSGAIPVPLFNRNRREIAEAAAARDLARGEAELSYESLVARLQQAQVRLAAARERSRFLELEVAPAVDRQMRDMQRLLDLREINVFLLQDVFTRSLETKLALLDATGDEAVAANELEALLRPRWVSGPAPDAPKETTP